jgi:hypothetical protein
VVHFEAGDIDCSGVVHFEAGDIDCLLGEWFILQLILTVEGWFILRLVILTLLRNGSF